MVAVCKLFNNCVILVVVFSSKIFWPPRSLYLTEWDFFWGYFKSRVLTYFNKRINQYMYGNAKILVTTLHLTMQNVTQRLLEMTSRNELTYMITFSKKKIWFLIEMDIFH